MVAPGSAQSASPWKARLALMPPVVGCVITHLPGLEGYHAERLEIVQACLMTMRERAGQVTSRATLG